MGDVADVLHVSIEQMLAQKMSALPLNQQIIYGHVSASAQVNVIFEQTYYNVRMILH